MGYDAFISYSHAADGTLAPRLQEGLQQFAKPWWRRRALHIFRDSTGLSVNPHLWASIEEALDQSEWLILLASSEAAGSPWIEREIEHWKLRKDPTRILPVVTDGVWAWDSTRGDFDWETSTAVPASLRGVYDAEPRHLDLGWLRGEAQVDLRNGRFLDAVADLAAPIHEVAKDELVGDDIHQHRRALRTAWAAAIAVSVLLVGAVFGAVLATRSSNQAARDRAAAVAARNTAEEQTTIAQSESATLTVRIVASRIQETMRVNGVLLDEQTASDQAECLVAQLDAGEAVFAGSDNDALMKQWLSIPQLAKPCIPDDLGFFHPLGLYDYSPAERTCLASAVAGDRDFETYIRVYLGHGDPTGAARARDRAVNADSESHAIRIPGPDEYSLGVPKDKGLAAWGEAESRCLLTSTLSTGAASVAVQAIYGVNQVPAHRLGFPCMQDRFNSLPADSIDAYRSSMFVQTIAEGVALEDTAFARDVAPQLVAGC